MRRAAAAREFAALLDTDEPAAIEQAIALYRERFADLGWRENVVYDGIPEALAALAATARRIYLCTSKPEVYARRIVNLFGLSEFLTGVYGADLAGALRRQGDAARAPRRERADRRVARDDDGDRSHDVRAARMNGARSVGVLWATARTTSSPARTRSCARLPNWRSFSPEPRSARCPRIRPGPSRRRRVLAAPRASNRCARAPDSTIQDIPAARDSSPNRGFRLANHGVVQCGMQIAKAVRHARPEQHVPRRRRSDTTGAPALDYLKPSEVVNALVEAGARKAKLPVLDLLVRGALSGAILGIATSLAITATIQTGAPIVGALIFPVGFVMIVLLGLELVTGSFALLPMAQLERKVSFAETMRNWSWVFVGNLAGSLLYAAMLWGAFTMFGEVSGGPLAERVDRRCGRSRTKRTAPPAGPPCSPRRCCATGWSAWAS